MASQLNEVFSELFTILENFCAKISVDIYSNISEKLESFAKDVLRYFQDQNLERPQKHFWSKFLEVSFVLFESAFNKLKCHHESFSDRFCIFFFLVVNLVVSGF